MVDDDKLRETFEWIRQADHLFVDCETNGLDYHSSNAIGMSISDGHQEPDGSIRSVYIPWGHKGYPGPEQKQADLKLLRQLWQGVLDQEKPPVVHCWNTQFDKNQLHNVGIEIPLSKESHDVMALSCLIDPDRPHGLKPTAQRYLGVRRDNWEGPLEAYRWDQDVTGDERVPPDVEAPYAAQDAAMTAVLYGVLLRKIQQYGLGKALELETDILPLIARITRSQFKVDAQRVAKAAKPLREKIEAQREEFARLSGWDGDPDDVEALRHWLYEERNYPVIERDRAGEPHTASWTIRSLAQRVGEDQEMLMALAELRESLAAWRSVYGFLVKEKDKGVVTMSRDIRQMDSTGSWKILNPPLYYWDSPVAQELLSAFSIPKNRSMVVVQAPDLFVPLILGVVDDEGLQSVCEQTPDVVGAIAEKAELDRDLVKSILYGKFRGMGKKAIMNEFNLAADDVDNTWGILSGHFPGLPRFINYTRDAVTNGETLVTNSGRKVWLPFGRAYQASRMLLAAKEADTWKRMALLLDRKLTETDKGSLAFPIEHGLVFEMDTEHVDEFLSTLETLNQKRVDKKQLPFPFKVQTAEHRLSNLVNRDLCWPKLAVTAEEMEIKVA